MTDEDAQPLRRVLICDDLAAIREVLGDVVNLAPELELVGEARDGAEAISEATRLRPDVILLDLAMPVMTGFDALPELRRIVPEARIIVVSGFASSIMIDEMHARGADQYVEKGSDIDAIITAVLGSVRA